MNKSKNPEKPEKYSVSIIILKQLSQILDDVPNKPSAPTFILLQKFPFHKPSVLIRMYIPALFIESLVLGLLSLGIFHEMSPPLVPHYYLLRHVLRCPFHLFGSQE